VKPLCSMLVFALIAASPLAGQMPVPRGIRQADQTEDQTQRNIPPPAAPRATIDVTKLNQDAGDLARIAQTIPLDVANIQKGVLPKDTIDKLRQIESLSKHLRKALSP